MTRRHERGSSPGWHYYGKSVNLRPLDDAVIDTLVDHAARLTSTRSYVSVYQLGGAVADVDEAATAYTHRAAAHSAAIFGAWLPNEPSADQAKSWAFDCFRALEPHQTGVYANFLGVDDRERVRLAYDPDTYARLAAIKARYDPAAVLRPATTIEPATNWADTLG